MGCNYKALGFHWWVMVLCKIVHLSNSRISNHYSLLFLSVSTAIDRKFNELRLWKFQFHWTCLCSLLISDQNKCAHPIDHTVAIRSPIIHSPIPPPPNSRSRICSLQAPFLISCCWRVGVNSDESPPSFGGSEIWEKRSGRGLFNIHLSN